MLKIIIPIISFSFFLEACLVGNPSSPAIFTEGLISKNQSLYIRAGYFYDNIYRAKYRDDIIIDSSISSFLRLQSQGAIITINIKNRWDLYTLLGVSKFNFLCLNLDEKIYTNERFCFAAGTKILLLKINKFDFSIDGKYFRTSQNAENIISANEVFPILTPHFNFLYEEIQGSLALSYKVNILIPYVGVSYLYSTITPRPYNKLILEGTDEDYNISKSKNSKNWGTVVGVCLVAKNKINVNIESRMVDQNSFNVTSEIRF